MCGLCGILGDGTHWADGMGRDTASAVPSLRRQARRQRVVLGNLVLRRYGMALSDWQGAEFVLRSRTGASQIVGSLGDLWPAAERLSRTEIDPLDPALLDALDAAGRD